MPKVNESNTERPAGIGVKFALVPKMATEVLIKYIYGDN